MNPFPVHDPRHNLRELIKECILIERHLFDPTKYCQDCIRKHFLTIEAFAGSELASLDINEEYSDAINLLILSVPNWQRAWMAGVDPREIAQEIRKIRKALSPVCFDDTDLHGIETMDTQLYERMLSEQAEAEQFPPQGSGSVEAYSTVEVVCPHCNQLIQVEV